jgi:dTDP-4-dehydrorhamnose reductase
MAIKISELFNLDERLIDKVLTADFPQPGKRPQRTGLIISKAIHLLDYKPHSFEQGLIFLKKQYESSYRQ